MRVKEAGESECRAVIVRTGIEANVSPTLSRPKGSPLPAGLFLQENMQNLFTRRTGK